MNKCEIAKEFDVSRATVLDWVRRGCPVGADGSMDPAAVAEWKCRRDMERAGLPPGRLPELVGAITRERANLERRIRDANAMPADMKADPGVIKAAIIFTLLLERELLDLAPAIIAEADPTAGNLPEKCYELVLRALASARGEDSATSPAPVDTRRGRSSPATGARRGAKQKTKGA